MPLHSKAAFLTNESFETTVDHVLLSQSFRLLIVDLEKFLTGKLVNLPV